MPKVKQPTIPALHKKLTTEFNYYVRLRDTAVIDGVRIGKCISCGVVLPIEKLQAGHFVPANKYFTRYDERNVNAQCVRCNKWLHGNPFGYMVALDGLYGGDAAYNLIAASQKSNPWTRELLVEAIERYKNKQERVR